jgi:hypothetical protein
MEYLGLTLGRGNDERLRTSAASAGRAARRSAPTVRRGGISEAPLWGSYMVERADGQASQSTADQEVAQNACH